jgi:hypothetical protein
VKWVAGWGEEVNPEKQKKPQNLYPQISQIAQIRVKSEKSIATKSAKAKTTNLYPQISQIAQIGIKSEKSIATKSAKAKTTNLYPQISQIGIKSEKSIVTKSAKAKTTKSPNTGFADCIALRSRNQSYIRNPGSQERRKRSSWIPVFLGSL